MTEAPESLPLVAGAPFTSLAEMQEQNDVLLEQQAQQAEPLSEALVGRIAAFANRVQLSGALFDGARDRRVAQSMLDYWASTLYRAGQPLAELRLAKFDEAQAPQIPDALCPYVGLRAFEERDSVHFFGRSRLVAEMLAKLQAHHLLAVVGSSGSGKSSAVLSGLLPVLKERNPHSYFGVMVPGTNPLEKLTGLLDIFNTSRTGLVLVVDQFEEVFTVCRDETVRTAFVAQLLALAQPPGAAEDDGTCIILTMRADFEDNVARLPALQEAFEAGRVDIAALGFNELRAAIEQPATQVGLKFEDGIVDDLANTILGERAGLPLLQFTLLRLWENRQRNRITKDIYRQVGNPRQALERSAESFYESLVPENQDALRRIFTKLVTPNENLEFTSNRLPRTEIYQNNVSRNRVDDVLEKLIGARLIKLTSAGTPAEQIEVAHEALIRNWPRLIDWLEESREAARQRLRWQDDARNWRNTRDPDLLLRGAPLQAAEAHLDELDEDTRAYVQASQQVLAEAEAAAQKREQELIRAEERAVQERKRRRQASLFTAALSVLLVMALAASVVAFLAYRQTQVAQQQTEAALRAEQLAHDEAEQRRKDADESKQLAERVNIELLAQTRKAEEALKLSRSREWAAVALNEIEPDPERAILIALKANQNQPTLETSQALHRAIFASHVRARFEGAGGAIKSVAYSPDGRRLAVAGAGGAVRIWEVLSRTVALTLTGHLSHVNSVAFSPNGEFVLSASDDGTARISRATDGQAVWVLSGHVGPVHRARYSQDGRFVVTAGDDSTARLWDVATGALVRTFTGHALAVLGADFSFDGTALATASLDRTVIVWDTATGEPITTLTHDATVFDVAFSPNAQLQTLATASADRTARVWAGSGSYPLLATFTGHSGWVYAVSYSPDGKQVATSSDDRTVRIWGWESGAATEVARLNGHTGTVAAVAFSPNGKRIATGSDDQAALVWDVTGQQELLAFRGEGDGLFNSVAFSPDGARIALGSGEFDANTALNRSGNVIVVDAASGAELLRWRAHDGDIDSIAFLGDGDSILTSSLDGTAAIWDALTGEKRSTFDAGRVRVNYASASPDGRLIAAAYTGAVQIWEAATGRAVRQLKGHVGEIWGLAFSADGAWLATAGNDKTARIWNVQTGAEVRKLAGQQQRVNRVAFSPDGTLLAASSSDGTVWVWRTSDGAVMRRLTNHAGSVYGVAFSPDGSLLASGSRDQTLRLWNVATGEEVARLSETDQVIAVAFSPDGNAVVSATGDKVAHVWAANFDALLALAHQRVTRALTRDECARYLKSEEVCS